MVAHSGAVQVRARAVRADPRSLDLQAAPRRLHHPARRRRPLYERWQVPIHAAGRFDDLRPVDGEPFRVTHWQPHSVVNDTDQPRVHLVIDRDVLLDLPPQPFTTLPIPDELADLVSRALKEPTPHG
jgi:hypothetical protein